MPASDAVTLRGPLEAVMREAGELARETARRPFKHWNKGHDHSPVSEGDIAVNALLQARLAALAPQAGIDLWALLRRYHDYLPLADALYGSAAYVPMADGAVYVVSVSASGLVVRPANEAAQRAVGGWR